MKLHPLEHNNFQENQKTRYVFSIDLFFSFHFLLEEIHSIDKKTIIGTDYTRLSLKTQSLLRSAIANLPTKIQFSILESKAMFRSFDLWYRYFKKLVITTIPDPDDLDDSDNIFI